MGGWLARWLLGWVGGWVNKGGLDGWMDAWMAGCAYTFVFLAIQRLPWSGEVLLCADGSIKVLGLGFKVWAWGSLVVAVRGAGKACLERLCSSSTI